MRFHFHALAVPALAIALALSSAGTVRATPAKPMAPTSQPRIRIENFTFSPATLTVKIGSTVTWTNGDDIPHNVVARNGAFRSKVLDTGDSFSFTFKSAGEFVYFCGLHPHMVGKIIVTT